MVILLAVVVILLVYNLNFSTNFVKCLYINIHEYLNTIIRVFNHFGQMAMSQL